jgi:hypothetical protein
MNAYAPGDVQALQDCACGYAPHAQPKLRGQIALPMRLHAATTPMAEAGKVGVADLGRGRSTSRIGLDGWLRQGVQAVSRPPVPGF